ncbi:hypothetical protein [Flavobacterium sp. FlaQc-47]|uniref:hypothetical protein n=1 Tax=Flavobacterium sp. FlaQc-47 TaxID=3374180 RepID=UPI0037580C36
MRVLLLITYFLTYICNAQDQNVKVTINNRNNYYFIKEKLIAIVSSKNDSISFKYKDTLLLKVEKYKLGKLISEADFIYDSDNIIADDYTFSEDYYDYYEKFQTKIPFINKYKMLDDDFYYIDAILDKVNWENYNPDKKLKSAYNIRFKLDIGVSNAKFSPFAYGTTIREIKLYVVANFLKEMNADFIDNPSGKQVKYKKYYHYDNQGRLVLTKTINSSLGKIENQEKFEYKSWQ